MSLIRQPLSRGLGALALAVGLGLGAPALAQNPHANPHAGNKGDNRSETAMLVLEGANANAYGPNEHANPHALLAGLNSILRSLTGLLHTADPRMAGIRDFVIASANCEINCPELQATADLFLSSWAAPAPYDAYVYGTPPTIDELITRYEQLMEVDTSGFDDPTLAAYEAELAALEAVFEQGDVAPYLEALVASSQQVLQLALQAAASPSRDYTDEQWAAILAWANETLGVEDAVGTIDELVALLE
jgi:hypothetical protein